MILYNVTVGIDRESEAEWLHWMKSDHIPKVMETGSFEFYKIFKLLSQEEESTTSYSIQYFSSSLEKVVEYLNEKAAPLVEEHRIRYKDKHVAFRTILEEV